MNTWAKWLWRLALPMTIGRRGALHRDELNACVTPVVRLHTELGVCFISVRMSRSVGKNAADRFMTRLAGAIARVEGIDRPAMEELLFESRRVMDGESDLGVVLRRDYSIPDYPRARG